MKVGIGYPVAESFEDAAKYWARARKKNRIRYYILRDDAPELKTERCAYCGNLMSELPKGETSLSSGYIGNRAFFHPAKNKSVVLHYICSWQSLLEEIFGVDS